MIKGRLQAESVLSDFMSIFKERLNFIMESFSKEGSWEQKYKNIIQWGERLSALDDSQKQDSLLVKGCQSRVWLAAGLENHQVIFKGDSDALITKGLLALMVYFYSKSSPKEILEAQPVFIQQLDLIHHLSPSRAGGLQSLNLQIKNYAKAFYMLEQKK